MILINWICCFSSFSNTVSGLFTSTNKQVKIGNRQNIYMFWPFLYNHCLAISYNLIPKFIHIKQDTLISFTFLFNKMTHGQYCLRYHGVWLLNIKIHVVKSSLSLEHLFDTCIYFLFYSSFLCIVFILCISLFLLDYCALIG